MHTECFNCGHIYESEEELCPHCGSEGEYSGYFVVSSNIDRKTRCFHKPTCEWARGISPRGLTFDNREEAIDAGYKPCKTCCS